MIKSKYDMIPLNRILEEYTERVGKNEIKSVAVGRYGIRKREDIYSKALTKDFTKYKVIYNNTLTIGMGSNQIDIGVLSENAQFCVSPAYHTFKIKNVDAEYLEIIAHSLYSFLVQFANIRNIFWFSLSSPRHCGVASSYANCSTRF